MSDDLPQSRCAYICFKTVSRGMNELIGTTAAASDDNLTWSFVQEVAQNTPPLTV